MDAGPQEVEIHSLLVIGKKKQRTPRAVDPLIWRRLTVLRGLSALYVLLAHVRNAFWWPLGDVSRQEKPALSFLNAVIAVPLRFPQIAVMAFFVVSGISIHLATLERRSNFDPLRFYVRRAKRLYPVLLVSMVLAGVVFFILQPAEFLTKTTLWSALGTLSFQQSVLTREFAGNSPYWSLANEGWYYVLYPLLLLACGRWSGNIATWGLIGLLTTVTVLTPGIHGIIAYYPLWLIGVLIAANLGTHRFHGPALLLLGGVLLVSSMTGLVVGGKQLNPRRPLLLLTGGLGLAGFIWRYLTIEGQRIGGRWLVAAGEVSYPLYLVHFPIVCFLQARFSNEHQSLSKAVGLSITALTASVAAAWLIHQLFERPYLLQSLIDRRTSREPTSATPHECTSSSLLTRP